MDDYKIIVEEPSGLDSFTVFVDALKDGLHLADVALSIEASLQPLLLLGLLFRLQYGKVIALFVRHDVLDNAVSHQEGIEDDLITLG